MPGSPVSVPLDKFDPNPFLKRLKEDQDHIDAIKASLLHTGLEQYPKGRRVADRVQLSYGHSRLAAFRQLYAEGRVEFCTMPVIIEDLTDLQLFEKAVVENGMRKDFNPVEIALGMRTHEEHFGKSKAEVARLYRCSVTQVYHYLMILKLEPEIQELIADGKLPHGPRALQALLSIQDSAARVRLAKEKAAHARITAGGRCRSVTIESVVASCARLNDLLLNRLRAPLSVTDTPAVNLAEKKAGFRAPAGMRLPWGGVRQAASYMCAACAIHPNTPEPAWEQISAAARELCDNCSLQAARNASICADCPGVELLRRLIKPVDHESSGPAWLSKKPVAQRSKNGG